MSTQSNNTPEERPEITHRAHPAPQKEQRRLYRPEDGTEQSQPVFNDWASI